MTNIFEEAVMEGRMARGKMLPSYQPNAVLNMILQLAAFPRTPSELCDLAEALGKAMHSAHYKAVYPLDMKLFDVGQTLTLGAQELAELFPKEWDYDA